MGASANAPDIYNSMYVELHAHSNFSLLDGASFPEKLVEAAAQKGMAALALTDHDGLYAAPRFCRAAKSAGIKPILGAEVTLEGGSHLTLLVRDAAGYANLSALITKAQLGGRRGRPGSMRPCSRAITRGLSAFRGAQKARYLRLSGRAGTPMPRPQRGVTCPSSARTISS